MLGYKEHYNGAAVCEWLVALFYAFYVWSFAIDFIPAVKTKNYQSRETELEVATEVALEERNGNHQNGNAAHNGVDGANGYSNGRVANGVHHNGNKPEVVKPSRNF